MFTIADLARPESLEEAYLTLIKRRNNAVLGGCAFLRMSSRKIGTAIDLSALDLNYIRDESSHYEIGAMATIRDIETHPGLNKYFNGLLPKAVKSIIGVQFRNVVTAGASVFSKFGFSDLTTALLVLDSEVELYKAGRMPLAEFIDRPFERDILTKIIIKKDDGKAAYQALRNSASDYAVLNAAVSCRNGEWAIAVGARPNVAAKAIKAAESLSGGPVSAETAEFAAGIAAQELSFGTNMRGTAEYRQAMCRILVKRAIMEVLQCR